MSEAELSSLIGYLESGIPAVMQMFYSSFVLLVLLLAGMIPVFLVLKIIRRFMMLGDTRGI